VVKVGRWVFRQFYGLEVFWWPWLIQNSRKTDLTTKGKNRELS
jgi:hypothetical protein